MTLDIEEDQTAPVSEQEVLDTINSHSKEASSCLIDKIVNALNEKRDAHNGIVTSIIYIIDCDELSMKDLLKERIIDLLTAQKIQNAGRTFLTKALNRLTLERPLFIEDLFESMFNCDNWQIREKHRILATKVLCVKAIRRAEHSRGGRPTILQQTCIDELCAEAITSCEDSIKIDTLSIILESRSTTKPLSKWELSQFKAIYQNALSLQEPALRQIFLALTNKMLKRLKDSHRVVMRDSKRYTQEERGSITKDYIVFLEFLINFCFDSIYCNAYFGSFFITISTLKLIIEHITFSNSDLPIGTYFRSKRCYDSILSCLNDTFEENKTLALNLLLSLPYNDEFICSENLKKFEEIANQLVSSVNPAHSLTCQYIFKLIIGLRTKEAEASLTKNQLLLQQLTSLVTIVEEGVEESQTDLVSALKHKPIYPKLTCIRSLLDDVEINEVEKDREKWKNLAKRIIKSSIDACESVSQVVCNLNPETIGHLPMDLKPVDVETLSKTLQVSLNISHDKLSTITSQMMLISGWKTIKECSLALGVMCNRFWWPADSNKMSKSRSIGTDPILESLDIIKIIDFFDHYLRNLRHRGAFEQAYNGFMMVTRRIWNDEQSRTLLINMLHQIMNEFKGEVCDDQRAECLKAYVTRRSAGLPFIVQAILNSEHKHDSKTLRWVMDSLFEVLENENSQEYQQIHCLNILRALIKEHYLGEKVLSYVGKTFLITLVSFKSNSFPIRNCANMLLKAIVDRTFGVNRVRDDIHRRNQLSFERFFSECPGLHAKMVQYLEEGLKDKRSLTSVHAVFIILFRLRPSLNPNEEYNADKIIAPFTRPILELAHTCPDYKLRELAAKLNVRLERFQTNSDELFHKQAKASLQFLDQVIINEEQILDLNRFHGGILLRKSWIESDCSILTHSQPYDFVAFTKRFFSNIFEKDNVPYSIGCAALDLLESCCIHLPEVDWLNCLGGDLDKLFLAPRHYEPLFENYVFKSVILKQAFRFQDCKIENQAHCFKRIEPKLSSIIHGQASEGTSLNLQGSILRFLRQLDSEFEADDFIDKLMDKLDIDNTAAYMTPFDKLRVQSEFDREKWLVYCKKLQINFQKNKLALADLNEILDISKYDEFSPVKNEDSSKFSTRRCNTPRSIELLAYASRIWGLASSKLIFRKRSETNLDKLEFLIEFVTDLPDCDVKCLALLCAGKYMFGILGLYNEIDDKQVRVIERFSRVLDDLADGDHSLTIRDTCMEVLRTNIRVIIGSPCKERLHGCMLNLLSPLIKLSQDEEHELRSVCQRVMLSLRDLNNSNNDFSLNLEARGGISYLIELITTEVFSSNDLSQMNHCLELLLRIIFNHSKNYSNAIQEEKERLFDKTKLNTFADHVATVRYALEGLKRYFGSHSSELIDLAKLHFPQDILLELSVVDSTTDDNTGDYSWRLKKVVDGLNDKNSTTIDQQVDNNSFIEDFLDNIFKSLDYFSMGYSHMLTDTEYIFHELSLYKRISFVNFVFQCTKHNLRNGHLVKEIRDSMQKIVKTSCSTTLLNKCLNLIEEISDAY